MFKFVKKIVLYFYLRNMWSVVCFTEDHTIAAVPKFWYRDGYCAWPNKSFQKYIERRVNPNELEFTHFKAKVLHTDIGKDLCFHCVIIVL